MALAIEKVVPDVDGSYLITYRATVKNFGSETLLDVSLTDSLRQTYPSPASFTVIGTPAVVTGSNLLVNPAFDGSQDVNLLAKGSSLQPDEQAAVLLTVRVQPATNPGPFYSSILGQAHPNDPSRWVTDLSNLGYDPTPFGAEPTALRFDLPNGLIGVTKFVETPTLIEPGVYDIPYTIKLRNMGSVPLKNVQVVDNLYQTFGGGALQVNERIILATDAGLKADTLYSGQRLFNNLLVDSLSTLPVGATRSIHFTVRVNVRHAQQLTFYNSAYATALSPDNVVVADSSMTGIEDDPDNDLDPRNNNDPTPITLLAPVASSHIGVALAVGDTLRQPNGSYNVTYKVVVQNFGALPLTHVALTDSLSKVFNNQTGATYSVVNQPVAISTGSSLKLNGHFNGETDPFLVIGDSTSKLAVGQVDTILVVINVASARNTTFYTSVYASAQAKTGSVFDWSTNGLIPDLNGNNDPTDLNEQDTTPLYIPYAELSIFIPEGFSPNGDGINDLFVIRGVAGLTMSLEVFNRWGNLVYQNEDYKNDWDGKPNTGITLNGEGTGVPDGTYYYVLKTSDGQKFVRYMTISR
ncbi:hypothetical protein GCM10028809_60950 [Spirosoma gilvum]